MKRRPGVRRWTLPHLLQVIFGDLNANDQTNATPADIRDTSEKRAEAIGQNRSTRILAIQHLQSVNNRTRCNSRLSASHVLACLSKQLGLASVLAYATSLCFSHSPLSYNKCRAGSTSSLISRDLTNSTLRLAHLYPIISPLQAPGTHPQPLPTPSSHRPAPPRSAAPPSPPPPLHAASHAARHCLSGVCTGTTPIRSSQSGTIHARSLSGYGQHTRLGSPMSGLPWEA